jgi:hypothetical protein
MEIKSPAIRPSSHTNPDCKDPTTIRQSDNRATTDGPKSSKRQMAFMEIKVEAL